MAATLWRRAVLCSSVQWINASRAVSVSAALYAKSQAAAVDDPVKKIFLDKLKEYQKSTKAGKSPAATPESEKQLQDEMARLKRIYGEGDLSKFPKFEFIDKTA